MGRILAVQLTLWAIVLGATAQPIAPTNVVVFSGDRSAILHWDPEASVSGYNVSRALNSTNGPFTKLNGSLLATPGFCDVSNSNGQTYYYQITAVINASSQTSAPSATVSATPNPF